MKTRKKELPAMAKKNRSKKKNGKKAGLIAFGATLLIYSLIFPFHKLIHFLIGGGLAALAGWVVKTMATPMKDLDKHAKSKAALDVTIIEDEYARGVVEKGVEMLDAFKTERDAINEYVFTRRIDETREALDKVLRLIIEQPENAHHIRKMNSYYLPTALKLLQSYRSAKQHGTSYMTMSETREDVLSTLDKLNEALQTELEAMVKEDLEDMDIEIDVFERMLKSDGLQEDELTDALRKSAHDAAKSQPISAAPNVKPAATVQRPKAQPVQPIPQPVQKPVQQPAQAQQPAPVQAQYKPEGVALDYEVQVEEAEHTPVPTLNVQGATASARQLQQGAPVLQVPQAPAAPDFDDALGKEHRQ